MRNGWFIDWFVATASDPNPARRFADAGAMLAAFDELAMEWEGQKQAICLAGPEPITKEAPAGTPTLSGADRRWGRQRAAWGLDDLGRPVRYRRTPLTSSHPDTVQDDEAGLVWQKGGSPYPVSWNEAHAHVQDLNRCGFAGCTRWRLPSVAELITLLRPPDNGRHLCLPPVFDPRQKWLWSHQRRSVMTAWFVNLELGYAGWQDMDCRCYVRAVGDKK